MIVPACPKCGEKVIKSGQTNGIQRYRCRPCRWYGTNAAEIEAKPEHIPICPKCSGKVRRNGVKDGAQHWRCRPCKWYGPDAPWAEKAKADSIDRAVVDALHAKVKSATGVQRYVITAAQNATPIDKRFWASLQSYAYFRGAQIIVIPYRYRNPTSQWSQAAEHDDWWAPELAPYLLDRRIDLNPSLVLLADIKTQPTASRPLMGFESITGAKSAILGHPKLELTTIPTPQSKLPKILTTTGAVTTRNYLPGKAGKKGEHHHTFGACVVEISGKAFHLRQINATKTGSFCDLDREYDGRHVRKARIKALVMGDSHVEFIDPAVVKATFSGPDSIVGALRPEQLVWHDLHDFYSRNHHHRGEVFTNFVKHHTGRDNVERALDQTFAFVDKHSPPDITNVFVASNHPDALARWVKESDPKTDPENCVFWAQTFTAMCAGAAWSKTGARTIDPFAHWARIKLKCSDRSVFLGRDQGHQIAGIEVGYHGDKGPNGSKGSINGFGRIGTKTIIAHAHTPGISDGVYRVGTSTFLTLEYTSGPSSWLNTHAVIYANGKRSLIHVINGAWRA